MDDEFYQEHILEIWRNPMWRGSMHNADFLQREFNRTCGDDIEMQVKLEDGKIIKQAMFRGDGCAISIVTASLLCEYAQNKSFSEIIAMGRLDVERIVSIPISYSRMRCALLSLWALQNGWRQYNDSYMR